MRFRHIKQLAAEGLAMTFVVMAGLVVVNRVANSGLASRAAGVPVAGTAVQALRSVSNAIVTPVSDS